MRDMAAVEIRRLHRKVAAADRRLALLMLPGKVKEIAPATRRLRLKIGTAEDGSDILGPWARWQEATAGGMRIHSEPAMDEQMLLISQSGTVGPASLAAPATYDQDHDAPSQSSDTAVLVRGAGRIELGPNGIRLVGPVSIEGESLRHNDRNIGDTHIHGGVVTGGDLTDVPAN